MILFHTFLASLALQNFIISAIYNVVSFLYISHFLRLFLIYDTLCLLKADVWMFNLSWLFHLNLRWSLQLRESRHPRLLGLRRRQLSELFDTALGAAFCKLLLLSSFLLFQFFIGTFKIYSRYIIIRDLICNTL